jgi:hypothetical protein
VLFLIFIAKLSFVLRGCTLHIKFKIIPVSFFFIIVLGRDIDAIEEVIEFAKFSLFKVSVNLELF